jgi:nitrogen-specific signal transduction histidine kinase
MSGGYFTSTTDTFAVTRNMIITGGTFSHNNGKIILANGEAIVNIVNKSGIVAPFFTTRGDRAGLGLTVAREIASEHGQQLAWRARPAGGLAALILPEQPTAQQRSSR